jgi:hypothetical protein
MFKKSKLKEKRRKYDILIPKIKIIRKKTNSVWNTIGQSVKIALNDSYVNFEANFRVISLGKLTACLWKGFWWCQ